MRALHLLLGTILVTTALSGCLGLGPDLAPNPTVPCGQLDQTFDPKEGEPFNPRVRMQTSNGTATLVVYLEQVPVTAGNFLSLVREDFYEETRFHLLRPDAFIQGGDPRSSSEDRRLWGSGGPGYTFPDEFHQSLRHDEAGMVSMAVSKPNSAGSQFLISLRPIPGLDDHAPVFARVLHGMDTIREISRTPTDDQNRPKFHAELESTRLLAPPEDPSNATVELSSYGFDCEQAAEPGGTAEFMLSTRNTGLRLMNGTFEADAPAGWNVSVRNADTIAVPSGQTKTYIVDVNVPADAAEGSHAVNVTFADKESDAEVTRELTVNVGELGADVNRGDQAKIHFVGVLEDGRVVDTTIPIYDDNGTLTWFKDPSTHRQPIEITAGQSPLIEGISELTLRAKVGQSVAGPISPSDGYGTDAWGNNDLGGRLLFFQVDVLPSDVEATPAPGSQPG